MSYINNFNPRRMIWFNQHEPKNKMDLWLSYNRHYTEDEDTSEESQTSDNPNQRACDLILKAWDCGKWNPIVGFNTVSANKIDCVEGVTYTPTGKSSSTGKNEFHPAIFTAETPNELYDAGSLGELLTDTTFVDSDVWGDIYQNYIKNLIEEYPPEILVPEITPALDSKLGGIYARTHTFNSNGSSMSYMVECKYPKNHVFPFGGSGQDYRLYLHAKEIIDAIHNYVIENPNDPNNPGNDFDLWLATTTKIGGIKSARHEYVAHAFKPVECKFYPDYTSWSSLQERLCINAGDVIAQIINSLSDPDENWLFGSHGITIGQQLNGNRIEWSVDGLGIAGEGKYARSKYIPQSNRHTIEWVDLPSGTTYDSGVGIYINPSGNTININTSGGSSGLVLAINASGTGVEWVTVPSSSGDYTASNGIDISTGDVISCQIENGSDAASGQNNTIKITSSGTTVDGVLADPYTYIKVGDGNYDVLLTKSQSVAIKKVHNNPCYFYVNAKNLTCDSDFINDTNEIAASGEFSGGVYLVVSQFGLFDIKKITQASN